VEPLYYPTDNNSPTITLHHNIHSVEKKEKKKS